MDLFDRRILAVLKDGEPREFRQILGEVEFSHNTLRRHLTRLEDQGFILKLKKAKEGPGRPKHVYSLPPRLRRHITLTITKPYSTIISLTFRKLRHICRFEKGGYCKKIKRRCRPQNCPQILKEE